MSRLDGGIKQDIARILWTVDCRDARQGVILFVLRNKGSGKKDRRCCPPGH